MRDGGQLVGWGMASGVWEALQMETAARIVLTANGHAEVSCATSDIGTGTYTIMAQVAAETLGLPIENVTIKLGDSTLPQSPVEGGSWMAASVSHAIANAAADVHKELLKLVKKVPDSPLARIKLEDVSFADGMITAKTDTSAASLSQMSCGTAASTALRKRSRPTSKTTRTTQRMFTPLFLRRSKSTNCSASFV